MANVRVDTGPARWKTRTIAGVKLVQTLLGPDMGWKGEVAGEVWCFVEREPRVWQAFTEDHLTGGPSEVNLKRLVAWVVMNQAEWKAKLRARRRAGTRMVDPVDNATKSA